MKAEDSRQADTVEDESGQNPEGTLGGGESDVTTRPRTKAEWERTSRLLDAVCERGNLKPAYWRVVKNKGAAGVDGIGIDEFDDPLKQHRPTIKAKLPAGDYMASADFCMSVPSPLDVGSTEVAPRHPCRSHWV